MSARNDHTMLLSMRAIDPLASLRAPTAAIADLAFGSLTADASMLGDGHLAILPADALELNLSDPAQRRFGDYELLELIGKGGMGVVYRAHQNSLDREVAVKLLAAGPWASREFIERFRLEAQHAARMQHPNIVAIHEVGAAEEMHFFSMRMVHGGSLAALLKREGRLQPRRAAQLLRTIAEAVDYAHRLGVLHLDLKPANVLLDESGVPHVADFGLARRLDKSLSTTSNEVSGTPSYMAPEQALGGAQKITRATDIWGLGAILYELVTGEPPFLGESPQDTLRLVVDGTLRDPCRHVPNLPRDLQAIILKCLARDVRARYASARELAEDLARFLDGHPVGARPLNAFQRSAHWARREPKIVGTALLALLALLIGLATTTAQWHRANANARRAEEQKQLAQNNAATSNERLWESRRSTALRLQADGKGFDALAPLVANIEEREKAGLSADIERREAGMLLSQGVTLIDRMIVPDASPLAVALSEDGSLLAIGLNDVSVRWYDTATLTERGRVDLLDQPTSDGAPRAPRLLRFAGNHRLLVTLDWFDYLTSPPNFDTILVDLDHARAVQPPPGFADFGYAAYSADGRHAILFDSTRHGQLWQVDPWRPLSPAGINIGGMSMQPCLPSLDGKRLAHLDSSMNGLVIADARQARAPRLKVAGLDDKHITAWQESRDGTRIALGDDDGRVYLVDVRDGALRTLGVPGGRAVTWLAFSEDDAWLAAARRDGDAFAFDVASGNTLHSGALQHEFELHHIELSHRDNLVIVSGAGDAVLWRMPEQGPHGGSTAATRVVANPTRAAHAGLFWAGASLQAGLLATADMDGEVRLWRLPTDPMLAMRAAQTPADRLPFDGVRLVDVAYDRIRVAMLDRRSGTDWLTLLQPPSYAELAGPDTLVAVAGRKLYAFDAANLHARHAPLELPATPQFVALRPDGAVAALTFGHNGPAGFEQQVRVVDLAAGKLLPGESVAPGVLRQFEFSPDGRLLLAVGSPNEATEVIDAATLRRLATYLHTPDRPVRWASFTADGASLWLLEASLDESEAESGRLLRWDVGSGRVLEQRVLSGPQPIGVQALGMLPLLATRDNLVLDPGGKQERTGPALRGVEVTTTFAVSPDGRLLAHAYGRNVQLYEAATLEPIGPPLSVPWYTFNGVVRLSFDPRGEHLLARLGHQNRLIAWPVPGDRRPLTELRRDAELLAPAPRTRRVLRVAETGERAWLRGRDPGAWPRSQARPAIPVARYVDGTPVPRRDPHASPLLLDLTDFYTVTPYTVRKETDAVLPSTDTLPTGIVRLDGVDYDLRGGVELRMDTLGRSRLPGTGLRGKVGGVRVPPVPVAAFHVLLYASLPLPEPGERTYALLRLHYRDGGEATLPIRTQIEVPGRTDHDRPTPIGWTSSELAYVGLPLMHFHSNPRLVNPQPRRIVASLDLETSLQGWSEPVFLAVTAEPVISDAKSGMSKGASGTGKDARTRDGELESSANGESP